MFVCMNQRQPAVSIDDRPSPPHLQPGRFVRRNPNGPAGVIRTVEWTESWGDWHCGVQWADLHSSMSYGEKLIPWVPNRGDHVRIDGEHLGFAQMCNGTDVVVTLDAEGVSGTVVALTRVAPLLGPATAKYGLDDPRSIGVVFDIETVGVAIARTISSWVLGLSMRAAPIGTGHRMLQDAVPYLTYEQREKLLACEFLWLEYKSLQACEAAAQATKYPVTPLVCHPDPGQMVGA